MRQYGSLLIHNLWTKKQVLLVNKQHSLIFKGSLQILLRGFFCEGGGYPPNFAKFLLAE